MTIRTPTQLVAAIEDTDDTFILKVSHEEYREISDLVLTGEWDRDQWKRKLYVELVRRFGVDKIISMANRRTPDGPPLIHLLVR